MTSEHKLFQIFRAGVHTAMRGQRLEFSEHDLELTASTYAATKKDAPLVLGHPENDNPSYGRVVGLFAKAGVLFAQAEVDPALAGMVRQGSYRYVSASFFQPQSPNNPMPGVYTLKHVGFLGATPPSVKGLTPPEFGDGYGALCFAEGCELQQNTTNSFQAGTAAPVDQKRLAVHNLAQEYQQVCPALSYSEAIAHAGQVLTLY